MIYFSCIYQWNEARNKCFQPTNLDEVANCITPTPQSGAATEKRACKRVCITLYYYTTFYIILHYIILYHIMSCYLILWHIIIKPFITLYCICLGTRRSTPLGRPSAAPRGARRRRSALSIYLSIYRSLSLYKYDTYIYIYIYILVLEPIFMIHYSN